MRQAKSCGVSGAGAVGMGAGTWQIGAMQVSFLIPAYNEEKLVGRAVGSVWPAAEACGLRDFEVVVCDNDSTDRTAEVAAAAGARVVQEGHRQIARSRNAAAAASAGRWLVWLDADATLSAPVLHGTLQALGSGKICGGGAQVELEGGRLDWAARGAVGGWNWLSRTFQLAAGSYFFALREGWIETGGFNERVYAGEEIGFARELKKWGRPRGLGFHVVRQAVPSSARKISDYTTWQTLRQAAVCVWPGNLGRRERCAYWYERKDSVGS